MNFRFVSLFLSALLFMMLSLAARAEENENKGRAVSVDIENDTRRLGGPGSDQAYSNGIRISYLFADNQIPKWAEPLPKISTLLEKEIRDSKTNFGLALAQLIFTPDNTENSDLIVNDRPYAAWLYLGFTAHFQNESRSHSFELDLGVVGPEAQGERIQNGFHQIIGVPPTRGWRNQLSTEPTVQLFYQQRLKFIEFRNGEREKYFDLIPYFGGGLGNVAIDAHVGGLARFGWTLPEDFGPTRASSTDGDGFVAPEQVRSQNKSLYVFSGLRVIAVGRNMFLDGNTFRESHHVTKYPFTSESEIGIGSTYHQYTAIWRFVTKSPEFKEKSEFNSFASITLIYAF